MDFLPPDTIWCNLQECCAMEAGLAQQEVMISSA
jgi:hypothetical protein